jgi:hypothetical protein
VNVRATVKRGLIRFVLLDLIQVLCLATVDGTKQSAMLVVVYFKYDGILWLFISCIDYCLLCLNYGVM